MTSKPTIKLPFAEVIETTWLGIDQSQEPDNLQPGAVQVADNMSLEGTDLITRPGLTALLSTPHSGPIRAYTPLVGMAGAEKAVYAADSGLYYWGGSNSASAVSGAGTVADASAQIALSTTVGFLADGSANLKRIVFDSSGVPTSCATLTELNRPDGTITAENYATTLDTLAAGNWDVDAVSGNVNTNFCTSTSNYFVGGTNVGTNCGSYWKIVTGTPKTFNNGDFAALPTLPSSGRWLRLDDPGDAVLLDKNSTAVANGYVENGYVSNAKWLTDASKRRYPKRFVFSCRATAIGTTAKPFIVRMKFYSNSATPTDDVQPVYQYEKSIIVTATSGTPSTTGNADQYVRFTVDLTDIVQVDIYYIRLYLVPDPTSTVTNDGPYVTDINFQSVHPNWKHITGTQGFMPNGEDGSVLSGLVIANTLSSTVDATGIDTLGFTLTTPATFNPPPSVEIQFADSSDNVWISSQTTFASTIAVDVTGMPSSIKSAIKKVALVFKEDASLTGIVKQWGRSVPTSDNCAFFITALVNPGNLIANRNYWYVLAEINSNSDATLIDVIYSDGSAPTKSVTTNTGQRQVKITLPARKNSSADYLALYRFGGAYLPDAGDPALPTGRLLCWIPWSTATFSFAGDTQKPTSPASGYPVVFANPYIAWTKTGSTGDAGSIIVDNTPDSWLSNAPAYSFGREKAPSAPTSVAIWDSRCWLAKGSDLYASWEIKPGQTAGLYWTRNALPPTVDPEAPKKGWWVRFALRPGDSIQKVLPVGTADAAILAVLTTQTVYTIMRSGARYMDRTNASVGDMYRVQVMQGDDTGGAASIYSATVFDDTLWWLSDRALLRWSAGNGVAENVGDRIRRLLPGIAPSINYNSTALAKTCLIAAPHFLYVSVPGDSSATTPDKTMVFHSREGGWTRWGKGFSGGSGEILAGFDGQLWRVGGNGDVTSVGGGASAVSWSLQTRRIGEGTMVSNPGRVFYSLYLGGASACTVTFSLSPDGGTANTFTQSVLGESIWRTRSNRANAGHRHDLTISGSSVQRMRVRALGIELLPRHHKRV